MTPQSEAREASWRFADVYLVASALVQVALIVVVVILVIQVSAVSAANHANAVTACQLANTNRTEDTTLFEELLKAPPHPTAAQLAAIARDLALVHKAYALRDCVALYSTGKS